MKILPQKYRNIGVAAFIDFYDVRSASQAHEAKHKLEGCDVRTNYKSKPTERFDRESLRRDNRWSEGPGAEKEEKATGARYRAVTWLLLLPEWLLCYSCGPTQKLRCVARQFVFELDRLSIAVGCTVDSFQLF